MLKKLGKSIKDLIIKGAIYLIFELLTFGCILLTNLGFLETIFGSVIIGLLIDQWLLYYRINVQEILLIHRYKKEGKEFNKEYYDLFWNSNLIRIRFLVVFEYIALLIYSKLCTIPMDGIINIFKSFVCGFGYLIVGFAFWVIWIIYFLSRKDNIKLEKLFLKKRNNFTSYTEEEKELLERND